MVRKGQGWPRDSGSDASLFRPKLCTFNALTPYMPFSTSPRPALLENHNKNGFWLWRAKSLRLNVLSEGMSYNDISVKLAVL